LSRIYCLPNTEIRKVGDTKISFNAGLYISQQRYLWECLTAEVFTNRKCFDSFPVQPNGMGMDTWLDAGPAFVTVAALYYSAHGCTVRNKADNMVNKYMKPVISLEYSDFCTQCCRGNGKDKK